MRFSNTVTCHWWTAGSNKEPPQKFAEALKEAGFERAVAMMKEGFTGGELFDCVRLDDEDGDGVEFRGWWSITAAS